MFARNNDMPALTASTATRLVCPNGAIIPQLAVPPPLVLPTRIPFYKKVKEMVLVKAARTFGGSGMQGATHERSTASLTELFVTLDRIDHFAKAVQQGLRVADDDDEK
jgi:hypothetical protein